MKMSNLLGRRFKEQPSEAYMPSHIYMLRGGYVRQVGNGIFSLLMPAKRVTQKIEKIIREEMDAISGQEVMFPVAIPADLWKESGRFQSVGSELMRMKDRGGRDMVLGMTHEEAAVHLARSEAQTYNDFPFMIYQIQTKFRDEPRARGGLIRTREFTMKDAYSFHTNQGDLELYYEDTYKAYERIFERVGLKGIIPVLADNGMMGGKISHEFMYLSPHGEDSLVLCDACGYRSNMEVAKAIKKIATKGETTKEKIHTPAIKDMEALADFFDTTADHLLKSAVFTTAEGGLIVVFIRGDYQVNEAKLRNHLGKEIYPYNGTENDGSGIVYGFIGPVDFAGRDVTVLYDETLKDEENLIAGSNEVDYHIKGVSVVRDLAGVSFVDVSKVNDGDTCTLCHKPLSLKRGIEIGNIFQLGDRYTTTMNMTYLGSDNQPHHPIMGCYGIGVGRLFSCIIEENHDDYGPIWPMAVAPWQIHICTMNLNVEEVSQKAEEIYQHLSKKYEVLWDDRGMQAGGMFADADLLGVPVRLVINKKNVAVGEIELSTRNKTIKKQIALQDLDTELQAVIDALSQE